MSPHAAPAALAPGQRFDRYVVVRCLSQGAMGAIYEVVHTETRGRAALKVLLPSLVGSEELRERFKREAMIGANIRSEHVVRTFDAGVEPNSRAPFLVMELLEGEDLEQALASRRRFTPAEVVTLLYQASLALDRAHALGVVHRDLKPGNLFLTHGDDGSPRLKVLDFGIAKVLAEEGAALSTTHSVGTPLYMAPEQILGEASLGPAADLYALGHVAFALLVGGPYWSPEASRSTSLLPLLGTIAQGAREPATVRARAAGVALPAALDAWFARASAVDPTARFASAGELVAGLGRALGVSAAQAAWPAGAASSPHPGSADRTRAGGTGAFAADPGASSRSRTGLWLVVGGVVVVGAVVALGLVVAGGGSDAAAPSASLAVSARPAGSSTDGASSDSTPSASAPAASPNASASASASSGPSASASGSIATPKPTGKPTGARPGYDPTKIR